MSMRAWIVAILLPLLTLAGCGGKNAASGSTDKNAAGKIQLPPEQREMFNKMRGAAEEEKKEENAGQVEKVKTK